MSTITDVAGKKFALKNIVKRINGVSVIINNYIDIDTFSSIVQTVAQTCFQDGEYYAENREIARRFVIIKYLTDIEIDEKDIEEIFRLSQLGNWFSQIENEITKLSFWGEIEMAIDRQIDYLIATQKTGFDNLCDTLSALIEKDNSQNITDIKEIVSGLNKINKEDFVQAVIDKHKSK